MAAILLNPASIHTSFVFLFFGCKTVRVWAFRYPDIYLILPVLLHQLISIARYIDDSGVVIQNVLGKYGLVLLWLSIGLFSIYLVYLYIDYLVFKND